MARQRRFTPVPPKGAIPVERIRAADLEGVNQLISEGKLSVLFIGHGPGQRKYLVPVTPSSTAPPEQ